MQKEINCLAVVFTGSVLIKSSIEVSDSRSARMQRMVNRFKLVIINCTDGQSIVCLSMGGF